MHQFWLLSVINLSGLQQPTAGKVAIEVSQAVSQFSLLQKVPLESTESHKLASWCQMSGPLNARFSFLPSELSVYILKAFLLYGHTRLGSHQGRFNHFIDSFIVWCHDTHVFWKNEKMKDASNLIFLYESDLLKGLNGHLSPEKFCQPSAGGISPGLLRSQVTWVVQPSIICLRMDVGEMCI